MDIQIDTAPLEKALESVDGGFAKTAYAADLAPETLKSVLSGKSSVKVESIAKAADHLGFKTIITFEPKNNGKKK